MTIVLLSAKVNDVDCFDRAFSGTIAAVQLVFSNDN
jgi:hypothetical protein